MSSRSKKKRELQYCSRMAGQQIEQEKAVIGTQYNLALAKKMDAEFKIADMTGRADGLTTIPEWKREQLRRKQVVNTRLIQNGITLQDLADQYNKGRKDATKEYVDKLLLYQQKFFYSAAAIAAHDLFGFGKERGLRLLDRIQEIMCEEISTGDIIERCKRETGVDVFEEEYTI